MFCAGFRHSAGFHARVILDGAACRLGELGEVDDVLGDCACSGVLVEGRVNEEDDVLVVNGERATKGETCADQMTDSSQAHKDVMQFLSQARCVCVPRL